MPAADLMTNGFPDPSKARYFFLARSVDPREAWLWVVDAKFEGGGYQRSLAALHDDALEDLTCFVEEQLIALESGDRGWEVRRQTLGEWAALINAERARRVS